jgi:hypothetical protein
MSSFQRSELTAALVRYLHPFDKGERITYADLTRAVAANITPRSGNLTWARRILQRDHNAVWHCVRPGVGLVRLNDQQIAERQRSWYLRGARNKLSAGAKQADVVDIDGLDIDQRARFATDSIIREIAREALSKATARRIEKVSRGTSQDLPTFSAVEWMISLSPRRSKHA